MKTENKLKDGKGSDASTCSAVCGKYACFKKLKSLSGAEAFENGLCELFTSNR